MRDPERDILERAVAAVAQQAAKADAVVDDLKTAGLPEDGPVLQAKLLRLELLKVKGDLEWELERWILDCRRCSRRVHWVSGIDPDEPGPQPPSPRVGSAKRGRAPLPLAVTGNHTTGGCSRRAPRPSLTVPAHTSPPKSCARTPRV